jgi:hypothetical protein
MAKVSRLDLSYPVCKLLEALGQAGQELKAGSGLGDQCESSGRTSEVSTCEFGAGGIASLVCEGARSWSCGAVS